MQNKKLQFEKLFDLYSKALFRYIYFRTNDARIAEDILSETFLKLWSKIQQGKKIENERALLYTIARGNIIDHYRSSSHLHEVELTTEHNEILAIEDEILERLSISQEISQVYKKLEMLKKEYQEVVILKYIDELEYSEIASIMKKEEGTVRVILHRALLALKKLYE